MQVRIRPNLRVRARPHLPRMAGHFMAILSAQIRNLARFMAILLSGATPFLG